MTSERNPFDFDNQLRSLVSHSAASAAGFAFGVTLPRKLVVVCCHAIWTGTTPADDTWLMQPFQKGETECFKRHMDKGLRVLMEMNGEGVLIFSG